MRQEVKIDAEKKEAREQEVMSAGLQNQNICSSLLLLG